MKTVKECPKWIFWLGLLTISVFPLILLLAVVFPRRCGKQLLPIFRFPNSPISETQKQSPPKLALWMIVSNLGLLS